MQVFVMVESVFCFRS